MPKILSVYLVRHGESEANLDKSVNATKADHAIELSPNGADQAVEAGIKLATFLKAAANAGEQIGTYVSPYTRTRQTWQHMKVGIINAIGHLPAMRQRESVFLREMEYGLFDGVADEDLPTRFPREYTYYEKLKNAGGEFYARVPGGESRCDVAQRVHQGFGTIHRDHERHGVQHAVVVSHGITTRAFVMMWLGLSPEWIEAEKNPPNCSIRLLRDGVDHGYVHNGRPGHSPARERREDGLIGV
jgi:2,3-bisphosphoglycerate-dependent phosphoglycerate mutase